MKHFSLSSTAVDLAQLRTTRPAYDPQFPSTIAQFRNANVVQNLMYTYDAVGNVVEIYDDAFRPAFFANQQIDPVARTVTARIRLANRSDILRIGLFGSARVSVDEEAKKAPVLAVPRSALSEIGTKTVVFVRHADDDFELHEVVLGDAALGKVEVVSGLRDGEQVVTDGVFTLKSAVLKSTLKEDD